MRVAVNGVRLFFDVEGAGLVPDGSVMREKPTLLLLHGGPGFVDTPMTKPGHSNSEVARKRLDAARLGRFGTSADIAAGCLYLASDEASWVTGSELVIDGG